MKAAAARGSQHTWTYDMSHMYSRSVKICRYSTDCMQVPSHFTMRFFSFLRQHLWQEHHTPLPGTRMLCLNAITDKF